MVPILREGRKMRRLFFLLVLLLCAVKFVSGQMEMQTGIPSSLFNMVAAAQQTDEWCWAASISMVLNYYGVPVSQQEIVRHVFGEVIVHAASDEQISAALNSWAVAPNGQTMVIRSVRGVGPPPVAILLQELNQKHPIVLTFATGPSSGHCVVITGAGYVNSAYGPMVNELILRDPWPSVQNIANQGRVDLTLAALNQFLPNVRSYFIVSVTTGGGQPSNLSMGGSNHHDDADDQDSENDNSDVFDSSLKKIIGAASDNFRSIRGARDPDGGDMYFARTSLPGTENCEVLAGDSPSFTCDVQSADSESDLAAC